LAGSASAVQPHTLFFSAEDPVAGSDRIASHPAGAQTAPAASWGWPCPSVPSRNPGRIHTSAECRKRGLPLRITYHAPTVKRRDAAGSVLIWAIALNPHTCAHR
jgi:hypothetical protein